MFLSIVSSRRLQDMSSRRLQDMSSRRLEDVFSVTFFRLPRRLQDVFKTSWCKILTLKTCWRRLQDQFAGLLLINVWGSPFNSYGVTKINCLLILFKKLQTMFVPTHFKDIFLLNKNWNRFLNIFFKNLKHFSMLLE